MTLSIRPYLTASSPLEAVTVGIAGNDVQGLAGVVRQDLVQTLLDEEDFLGMDLDIRGLALKPPSGWWIIIRECGRQ